MHIGFTRRIIPRVLLFVTLAGVSIPLKSSRATDLSGTWQGRLRFLKADFRLVFRIDKDSLGNWSGTLQSPEQSKTAYPVDELKVTGDTLSFEVFEMETAYRGVFDPDSNAIIGRFEQRGFRLPMKLLKGEESDLLYDRPQRPRPPYPYHVEEVRIFNPNGDDTLAGTLTRPVAKGKYPAVVLITGSGPEDRDETVFGHKPFLLLADYLTRMGYAVLRCDDRGTGASTGDYSKATPDDFASDISAQVKYLRKRKDIDHRKVGLLGHSEGGIIAPMVAAADKRIAFVILLAAPAMDFFDLLLEQGALAFKAEGTKQKEIDERITTNRLLFEILRQSVDSSDAQQRIVSYLDSVQASDAEIERSLKTLCTPWMRWYIGFDPTVNLKKLRCPVLAMNGEKDVQVPSKSNLPRIAEALKSSGNRFYSTVEFPGLNHLFQPCKKCGVSEYVDIETTMDPKVLETIGEWLEQQKSGR